MSSRELTNIQIYRKKWHINIGIIVFVLIFIYLLVMVLLYLTGKRVSAYEVREGSILKDTAYTGFIIREESVVSAEADGYVNYFASEGEKVGAKTNVYTSSPKKLDFEDLAAEDATELSVEEQASLVVKAQSFSENFKDAYFNDVYLLKDAIAAVLESKSSRSRQAQLNAMIEAGEDKITVYKAANDGIVIYSTDGYENVKLGDVTKDMIAKSGYEKKNFTNNEAIKSGDPAYKLITDDKWVLAIELDNDTAQEMADMKRVKVRVAKDNEMVWADFAIYNTKDSNLGFLTFDGSMIRYAQERYLDIELILEDESGLKIPKSAVVDKEFYVVPEDYITQGGNSQEKGVLLGSGKENAVFQRVDVYYQDNQKGMVYLNPDSFEGKNRTLVKPDSAETLSLKDKKHLKGVYNINKGYALFKQTRILCEGDEYYIVEAGNDYGLANYDHIALDGKSVRENDIIF